MDEKAARKGASGGKARVLPARRRFTVDEYYRMAEAGILHEDDHTELLEGEVFQMGPIGSRHAECLRILAEWFFGHLAGAAIVSVQNPVHLSDGSEPEPDLALLRRRPKGYGQAHPGPSDILLLMEVADTSLAYDRDVKLRLYAEAGIVEVWIVDLTSNQVLVYREPSRAGYRTATTLGRRDTLSAVAFPDLRLAVDELLR